MCNQEAEGLGHDESVCVFSWTLEEKGQDGLDLKKLELNKPQGPVLELFLLGFLVCL